MHSFHHSRGRILFDVFCALVVAAASAVAWSQTGASALLALAAVAAVYAVVHATDRPRRAVPAAPFVTEPAVQAALPTALVEPEAEPPAPKAPKPRSRKKKAAEAAPVAVVPEVQEVVIPEPVEDEPVDPWHQGPIEPLFEPQPALRQQRAVFGRKSG